VYVCIAKSYGTNKPVLAEVGTCLIYGITVEVNPASERVR